MENIKLSSRLYKMIEVVMPNYLEFCGHSADSRAGLVAEPPCCEMFAAEAGSSAIVVGAV